MAPWLLLALAGTCVSLGNAAPRDHHLVYENLVVKDSEGNVVSRLLGDLPSEQVLSSKSCLGSDDGAHVLDCREFADGRNILVKAVGPCIKAETAFKPGLEVQSIFEYDDAYWFGGGEEIPQKWPLNKYEGLDHSMVTQEAKNRGIQDAVWFSSKGRLVFVEKGAPLFLKWNKTDANDESCKGKLCLRFKDEPPYRPRPGGIKVTTWQCDLGDAKAAFKHAVDNFLAKPTGIPDERMIKYPVWSTWVKFKANINDSALRSFAKEIKDNGFENSQFEIDDAWETCYGSKIVDKTRFPDMKKLTDDLKQMGFRVTIWTHPFIQSDCTETLNEAHNKGYLVPNMAGDIRTKWWNGWASIVDFTNSDAAAWFEERHKTAMEEYGFDGYKFDAGETSWFPQLPNLPYIPIGPEEDYPSKVVSDYVRTCARFNNLTEVRSAYYTQDLPIFLRMIDKDSIWTDNNGLKSLVTTLLQMNMVGYSLVLPDMIGGNQYNGTVADQELFLRWVQANAFMPAIQYSVVPWDFGDKSEETVKISKKFNDLHAKYTDIIIKAMRKNVEDGSPVNPPIWWLDPADENALAEDSEYLLGENILVAPILEKGAVSRTIYLPKGVWRDMNQKDKVYTGPVKIDKYNAPLDTLPWFTIVGSDAENISYSSGRRSTAISLFCFLSSLIFSRLY